MITKPEHVAVVAHILDTYKAGPGKGAPYPFCARDGKTVQRLLSIYGVDTLLALWDQFLTEEWDWFDKGNKRVKVPRDLNVFQLKITTLLEAETYKKRIKVIKEDKNITETLKKMMVSMVPQE